jgi:hypothetical protein
MKVEYVNCAGLDISGDDDGVAGAVARAMLEASGTKSVESGYVGFGGETFGEVLGVICDSLKAKYRGPARVADEDVPHEMRKWLAGLEGQGNKIVICGGDAEDLVYGYTAFMIGEGFDTRAALDKAGLGKAAVETADEASVAPKL